MVEAANIKLEAQLNKNPDAKEALNRLKSAGGLRKEANE